MALTLVGGVRWTASVGGASVARLLRVCQTSVQSFRFYQSRNEIVRTQISYETLVDE